MTLTKCDVGFALRDHLEGREINPQREGVQPNWADPKVELVDVSDPENPIVHVNGQMFLLRIIHDERGILAAVMTTTKGN